MSKPAKITILTICIVIVGFFSIAKFLYIVIIVPEYIIETVKEEQEITPEDLILESMPKYAYKIDHGYGFDCLFATKYAEYHYDDDFLPRQFENVPNFKRVTPSDILLISEYVVDFEEEIECTDDDFLFGDDLKKYYLFNLSLIDTDDYFYLYKTNRCYILFYYDSQSNTTYEMGNY